MSPEQEEIIMKADIREVKLMDGSTIIAEVLEDNSEAILLFDPLQVLVGMESASFVPWFLTSNDRYIQLHKEKLLATLTCDVDYKVKYLQATLKKQQMNLPLDEPEQPDYYIEVEEEDDNPTMH